MKYGNPITTGLAAIVAIALALAGCGGSSTAGHADSDPSSASPPSSSDPPPSNPPPAPAPLAIATTSLPAGTVGNAYAATLAASGGSAPYKWSVTGGSLPSGLSLNAATGAITGTPSSPASQLALTFQVTDSSSSPQTATATLSLSITAGTISIAISPGRAGLTAGQLHKLTATTSDSSGVSWSIAPAGGSFSSATTSSGEAVILTVPQTAGVYTITATSTVDTTQSASIQVGVTDLAGVYTYHDDLARDGANQEEYALTPEDVNSSSFGKLFSCTVDGAIYAQPLWVANVEVGGAPHNVVYVATEHDSLYAFDADANPCTKLWQVSLIDLSHGGTGDETTIPAGPSGYLVGKGYGDLTPEVGVTGTPVIDPATGTLYVVSKSMNAAGTLFYQRLHAIDITSGAEKTGSPVDIAATYPGTAAGGSTVPFSARMEDQRPGLAFYNGTVYIAWGSHEDALPYYGWVIGYSYDGAEFTETSAYNSSPNTGMGGIWMSGAAPAIDEQGRLYVLTGNGAFDAASPTVPNNDYGDSLLQLSASLQVLGYFTPSDQQSDDSFNNDFGSGGPTVLADLPAGSPVTHLAIAGGKDGNLYVYNRDSLGGFGDSNAWQETAVGTEGNLDTDTPGVLFSVGAIWNDYFYLAGAGGPLQEYQLDPATAKLSLTTTGSSPSGGFLFPGATPSISAEGSTNGIVWVLDNSQFCTRASPGCGPAVLHAYDATNVANELWNSAGSSSDQAGNAVKFTVPTVANGKVYVGTRGNNTGGAYGSTSKSGELDVYGLKP
ncbi:MAG TPA: Ig domain-containing protein [Steroidobacteraceae bacterium]|nr:Ig domain-containing protein [Steroidobacteraceae bacterium]